MTLAEKVDSWCAAARRRLHREIDRRARYAAGEKQSTVNRSVGQLYRDREAEARETQLRA